MFHIRCCHCTGSRLPWKQAMTVSASLRIDHKHESVGKSPQQSTADVFVYDRELSGIGNHAFDHGVSDGTEASAQTTGLVLVPVLRVNQLEAGNAGEDNRAH